MSATSKVDSVDRIASGVEARLSSGDVLRVEACTPAIFRARLAPEGRFVQGGLERYGFLKTDWPEVDVAVEETARNVTLTTDVASVRIARAEAKVSLLDGRSKLLSQRGPAWSGSDGFGARFELPSDETFVGFGDQTRERIEHRGHRARMWVRNVNSYSPVPFFMSSRGYGLLVNSTWRHLFDMGATEDDSFGFGGPEGQLDYFLMYGPTYAELLDRYTDITGKPYVPPLWSFGLWFICHTEVDARAMLDDCLRFRERNIPCDVIGLEPGWMERNYDFSTDKAWHPERFKIPPYCPRGPHNFLDAARRMGFKPMLWLCCDYDLSIEEERRLAADAQPVGESKDGRESFVDAFEDDEHLWAERRMDTVTKPGEAWFEHLKKFVDQGVELFKQDGANQVLDHPDRKWANGMDDEEMHNLNPLLYAKQMHLGFREHTGRRATVFTPSGFAGMQRWTGTWAGDTGGGPKPLVSMLNLSLSGHSLMTCDMEVTTKEGIHFGFLQPWAQLNSWNYWRQPWYQGADLEDTFRRYCHLRYELMPYIYSMAHQAHRTGMPIMRAMPLMYPDDERSYTSLTQYMLGDCLLVSAFSDEVFLPQGAWMDYWTGDVIDGGRIIDYAPPDRYGGGLFAKVGSIIPKCPVTSHLDCKPRENMGLLVVAGADALCTLIEDDGVSYDYETGNVCDIGVTWREAGDGAVLTIGAPSGLVERVPAERVYQITVRNFSEAASAIIDGEPMPRPREDDVWYDWPEDETGQLKMDIRTGRGRKEIRFIHSEASG